MIKKIDGPSIQLGDMAHGFPNTFLPELPSQHKFIRGNHDNPELCKTHPNYLGEFGYIEEWDIFYLGGGWSTDWDSRIPGVSWWYDEELSMRQCYEALKLYEVSKPRIVLSHDCPEIAKISMLIYLYGKHAYNQPSRTNQLLQAMFELHNPSYWCFGHFHHTRKFIIHKTAFQCLGKAQYTTIEV
jgi:predicted phosphodiesterase